MGLQHSIERPAHVIAQICCLGEVDTLVAATEICPSHQESLHNGREEVRAPASPGISKGLLKGRVTKTLPVVPFQIRLDHVEERMHDKAVPDGAGIRPIGYRNPLDDGTSRLAHLHAA